MKRALPVCLSLGLLLCWGGPTLADTSDTVSNQVSISYADAKNAYTSASNTVEVTLASVHLATLVATTPSCASGGQPVAVNSVGNVLYTLTNTGNLPDTYTVTTASSSAGSVTQLEFVDGNGVHTPITVGSTLSPTLAAGASISILEHLNTASLTVGEAVTTTLGVIDSAGVASGRATATACLAITAAPQLTGGTTGHALPIALTANGSASLQILPGGQASIATNFTNPGGVAAQSVSVSLSLPSGVTPQAGSFRLNGVDVSGGVIINGPTVTVPIGDVAPSAIEQLAFTVGVASGVATGQTLSIAAVLSGSNIPSVTAVPTTLFLGVASVIFDALDAQHAPIAGATLSILDTHTQQPLTLSAGGIAPNVNNLNPFTTGVDGTYSFFFPALSTPTTYEVDVVAPGHLSRRLSLQVSPIAASSNLFNLSIAPIDGYPLATSGGFTLVSASPGPITQSLRLLNTTSAPVQLSTVNGFFGNIPLFASSPIAFTLSLDRTTLSPGDHFVATITASTTATTLTSGSIVDTLPPGVAYAGGSARLNGVPIEPTISGSRLSWPLPTLSQPQTLTFAAVVLPTVTAPQQLIDTASGSAVVGTTATTESTSASASATLTVVPGLFSPRVIIVGRVAGDTVGCPSINAWGRHAPPLVGIPGVRLFLENGESAATDAHGRYSFPATTPFVHTLALDPLTIPPGFAPCSGPRERNDEGHLHRLVHGLFDTDTMQRLDFVLERRL